MNRYRARLHLRLNHPTRDLSIVCNRLGLKPARIWKRGDERRTPKGNSLGGRRASSSCAIDFGPTSRKTVAKQIAAALERLEPHRAMLRRLSSTGGTASFSVGWFLDEDSGETFSSDLLRAMTRLQIALDLHAYLPDAVEPPEGILER
ncbi:DUF4279 domain-containing protein [Bradyrhizobium manausense]|uniref:DUF4279 domain-containing protein n=1 Tax=Bradyrhizobium TaxID=374 RepID=UPI001BA63C94|nr:MULTISPECIES: DUF4279 domain-containing protein [Bradyrhizobium]MBR0825908.1 DUF4279 domain-containing protein [Bradyrhizobium manausense]UVO31157.1 DUF4279 domain-containing protein [Bradyrhizobium arachidis]